MKSKIAIFGTAGHAQDIASCIHQTADYQTISEEEEGQKVPALLSAGYQFIIGIGDNRIRAKIAEKYAHLPWATIVTHGAHISPDAVIGPGTFIGFGVFISHHVIIGRHAIVHCNAVVGHDTVMKDFSQIAPGVCIGGNGVSVEEGALIGTNSTIINRPVVIGAWSVVGVASQVTHTIPERTSYQAVIKHVGLQNG